MAKGGKSPKRKGDKFERDICKLLGGERSFWQPENSEEEKRGDLINVPYLGRGEVKARKDGFKQIYGWLNGVDFLAIKADRKKPLVVMAAEDLKLILEEMDELKRRAIK